MKKPKNKNKTPNFFFTVKNQIIFYILVILFSNITNKTTLTTQNISKIIKFKLNGEITISDKDIVQNSYFDSPLIFTKINEKNINFKDNNVLPTQDGELNLIDPDQHITLLDVTLEEFFINSPMIIKKYPNLLFISNRTMSLFSINIGNGSIYNLEYYNNKILNINDLKKIKEICPKNKNDVLFLRIDYYLQMKYNNLNNNNKNKSNEIIWHSHYIKLFPIYPKINIKNNNYLENIKNNNKNENYYIFEVIENKKINLIYSQDKYIFMQIKDFQNEFIFHNYYFQNNKRKHLFECLIRNKNDKTINLSFKSLKKFFILIIIIFSFIVFTFNNYKSKIMKNSYNNCIKNTKIEILKFQTNFINDDKNESNNNNIQQKQEKQIEKPKSPRSKSISNLSTTCIIEKENKSKEKNENIIQFFSLNNIKFKFNKNSSGKKRDNLKKSSSKSSLNQKRRMSYKRAQNLKNLFKNLQKFTEEEKNELNSLFDTYINDITKNTNETDINLNFNLSENEEKYKKIFSLIKSEDSSSSDEINLSKESQGFFSGELENNFLFYFDNGRLLKTYKDFEFIGKGGFGVVFKATNIIDESQCAIKVMKINLDLKEEKEDLKVIQEIKTMLKFKKKNIVRYKTCWFEFKQKKVKKKRKRAMSLEERYVPSIDFKDNFLEKGDKNINNRLKKHLKTPLERIQSISKELKLAVNQNQNNAQKKKDRKMSLIWDSDDEESDVDSLGANKNFEIKEEGEDNYINLEDNEKENNNDNNNENNNKKSDDISEDIDDENEDEDDISYLNENDNEENNSKNEKDFNESNNNENIIKTFNNNGKIIDIISNSKSNSKINNNESKEENNKKNMSGKYNYYNKSSSNIIDNSNSFENYGINLEKDSENNSIFEEEIRKEKEELKMQNLNLIKNSKSEELDKDLDEDEDLNNNSEEGLILSKTKKKRKNKKYPIYFFIQMEYCSGCPMNYYLSHRACVPSKKLTTYMFYQLCKAVKIIHEGNIIHRDLKPGNIFIIDDYIIKLGDFGLALNSKSTQNKQGGTYLYQSPEQINNQPFDEKIDIFALGVILVELVSKFNTDFERCEVLQGLKNSKYPEYLKEGHLKEYNLVKKMTTLNPKERPNIKDIFKDNDFNDLINESLKED